jgi:hypothetical protein
VHRFLRHSKSVAEDVSPQFPDELQGNDAACRHSDGGDDVERRAVLHGRVHVQDPVALEKKQSRGASGWSARKAPMATQHARTAMMVMAFTVSSHSRVTRTRARRCFYESIAGCCRLNYSSKHSSQVHSSPQSSAISDCSHHQLQTVHSKTCWSSSSQNA